MDKQTFSAADSREVKKEGIMRFAAFAFIVVIAIIMYIGYSSNGSQEPEESTYQTDTSTTPEVTVAADTEEEKSAEDVSLAFEVNGVRIGNKDEGLAPTERSHFILINVSITNKAADPRDVSTNLFTLIDGEGRTFEAADLTGNDYLFYDTINPGLTRTYYIAFETPNDASGFKLEANSSTLFSEGEPVIIDLNM